MIRLIFTRFRELGSARQVLLSMKADQIHFPPPSDEGRMTSFDWVAIRYRNVIAILKNLFMQGFTYTGKARNAPPSSKGGHGGAAGMASRSGHRR